MLMYLASWKESAIPTLRPKPLKDGEEYVMRTWRGYDHDILDTLTEKGFVANRKGETPLIISKDGAARAQELLKKYGLSI